MNEMNWIVAKSLKYRYLDLRRPRMQRNLRLRHEAITLMRQYLNARGFLEVETPIMIKSTPEGARDYVVPSRVQPGKFYALPQSPQQLKQLLMVAGYEKYYQIARCFRDEDLRADRQPEFTQLDIETSFMDEDAITGLMESMIREVFKVVLDVELPNPFPRMSWHDAVERFGTDRPDLRIPLELVEVGDLMEQVEFKVFSGPAADPEGRVAVLRLPEGAALTRKEIDGYTDFVYQADLDGNLWRFDLTDTGCRIGRRRRHGPRSGRRFRPGLRPPRDRW